MATKKTQEEIELGKIKTAFDTFISKLAFGSKKTYKDMAFAFGQQVHDMNIGSRFVNGKDLKAFRLSKEKIIYDKYKSRRFIPQFTVERTDIPKDTDSNGEIRGTAEIITENIIAEGHRAEPIVGIERVETIKSSEQSSNRLHSSWVSKYPDQKAELITDVCNQPLAASTLWSNFEEGKRGQWLLAPAGIGKTYILGSFIKNFIEKGWIKKCNCISPMPIVYVTKASIVLQTRDVLKNDFNIDVANTVHVVNIELLRSSFGKLFVKETLTIKAGVEHYEFKWNPYMHPLLIIWDECQQLARDMAQQTKIACAFNEIPQLYNVPVFQIGASATPMSRVCEGKHFACSTGMKWNDKVITNENWPTFANHISYPFIPEEYEEACIQKFLKYFDDCIVRVKDIKLKYKSFVSTHRIHFKSHIEEEEYQAAWDNYQKKKAKIEGDKSLTASQGRFAMLAQFIIFRKAAEKIKRYHFAEFVVKSWDAGKAPALGLAFKGSMVAVYKILVEDYGWQRKDVSFIWGGSTESLNDKQKLAKQLKAKGLDSILQGMNISMEDLGIDMQNLNEKTTEQYEFEKEHNLLSQKPEEREKERLRFQRQDSRLLLFSYKAGGTGLSAHHERRFPKARQREGLFSPVYSEKETIQALGRLARITSISDTYQVMAYYANTIEVDVMARLIMKLKCARHVGKGNDSWESIITGRSNDVQQAFDVPMIGDIPDQDDEGYDSFLPQEILEEKV